uniref:SUN domain-containing protein n=2 Tax=Lygus hesperus TaxID=30085 RepID=A0A0K8SWT4_LYGHE
MWGGMAWLGSLLVNSWQMISTCFGQAAIVLCRHATSARMETSCTTEISPAVRDEVIRIVDSRLEEYHADRTGKPDYALGSLGAAIASIFSTRPYTKRPAEYVPWEVLHWEHFNTPDVIIKPGIMPGECWAFEGRGFVAIQLSMPIYVSGFSLEHTPKELTPFGHIESAPRKFSVWGLLSLEDKDEEFLGRFEFEDNGKSLQTFDAVVREKAFHLVELRIESNHGHLEYTCLYRFRVHGRPAI